MTFPATSVASAPYTREVTLALIEQAVARRAGPFQQHQESADPARVATTNLAFFDTLKSSANLGGPLDLWMLRRRAPLADRQRLVQSYDPLQGSVTPDRPWSVLPAVSEPFEFHHLDPANELRPAVLAGLARCFFEDRATLTFTAAATERDLTASLFWLTEAAQVRRVQFSRANANRPPADQPWFTLFEKGGHLWLSGVPDEYPNSLIITALRPHTSYVNSTDSRIGPTNDDDVLAVPLEYAAAAGHVEAWRMFPSRLQAAAAAGFQASQQIASAELTRQASLHVRQRAQDVKFNSPFGRVIRHFRAR